MADLPRIEIKVTTVGVEIRCNRSACRMLGDAVYQLAQLPPGGYRQIKPVLARALAAAPSEVGDYKLGDYPQGYFAIDFDEEIIAQFSEAEKRLYDIQIQSADDSDFELIGTWSEDNLRRHTWQGD